MGELTKVLILILTWNAFDEIRECLRSVKKLSRSNFDFKILIINNNSTDGTTEILEEETGTSLIKNSKNLGWGKAVNQGVKIAEKKNFDWVFILNPDVVLNKNCLEILINFVKENKNAKILAPVVEFQKKGKILYDLGGYLTFFGRTRHKELESLDLISDREPHYVSGAAVLIETNLFKQIGYFREDYFLYFEDVDFCLRAKKSGFAIFVVSESTVGHKLSSSIGFSSPKNIYYNLRNNLKFIDNNFSTFKKIPAFIYLFLLSGKIIFNNSSNIDSVARAWQDFIINLSGPSKRYD